MTLPSTLSVVVPVRAGGADPIEAYLSSRSALENPARVLDFVFVLAGPGTGSPEPLLRLRRNGEAVRIVRLRRAAGDAAALRAALPFCSGSTMLALSSGVPLDPGDLSRLVAALEDSDLAVAAPEEPPGGLVHRFRAALRSALLRSLLGVPAARLGGPVWAGRREVFEEVPLLGVHDRFLPALASRLGFRVSAVALREPGSGRGNAAGKRETRGEFTVFDLLSTFFLSRFSRKPLRFFGLLGGPVLGAGIVAFAHLLYVKLVLGEPLANRPLLLLAVLLLVLGAQIVALGLVAEIVVFTHLRDVKDYSVEEIVG